MEKIKMPASVPFKGYDGATMRDAERMDKARARVFTNGKISKTGRLVRQVDVRALMNAVNTEGREVLSADEYWKDMDRRHPHIRRYKLVPTRAMRNRFGRVKERKVYE